MRHGVLPDMQLNGVKDAEARYKVLWVCEDGHTESYVYGAGNGGVARRQYEAGQSRTDVVGGYITDSNVLRGTFGELGRMI